MSAQLFQLILSYFVMASFYHRAELKV